MVKLKRNLLSVALASVVTMSATGAYAQSADETTDQAAQAEAAPAAKTEATELETVTVTGIRAGIEGAISVKRDATSIVEAVTAEDIGKLPDVSIAESIGRLPGLAAQRVAGRAQSHRAGVSPTSPHAAQWSEMSAPATPQREFDHYPSERVSGVNVYKTPYPASGQGLRARSTCNRASAEPYGSRLSRFAACANRGFGGTGRDGRRYISYIDQFADNTFGIALGFSFSNTPIQENQVGLYEPWQAIGDNWRPGVPTGTYYSDGIKALRRTGEQTRTGLMATLQYRPSNAWTSTLDMFHSSAEQVDTANQLEVHIGDYNVRPDRCHHPVITA